MEANKTKKRKRVHEQTDTVNAGKYWPNEKYINYWLWGWKMETTSIAISRFNELNQDQRLWLRFSICLVIQLPRTAPHDSEFSSIVCIFGRETLFVTKFYPHSMLVFYLALMWYVRGRDSAEVFVNICVFRFTLFCVYWMNYSLKALLIILEIVVHLLKLCTAELKHLHAYVIQTYLCVQIIHPTQSLIKCTY